MSLYKIHNAGKVKQKSTGECHGHPRADTNWIAHFPWQLKCWFPIVSGWCDVFLKIHHCLFISWDCYWGNVTIFVLWLPRARLVEVDKLLRIKWEKDQMKMIGFIHWKGNRKLNDIDLFSNDQVDTIAFLSKLSDSSKCPRRQFGARKCREDCQQRNK